MVVVTQLITFLFIAYFLYLPGIKQYSHLLASQLQTVNSQLVLAAGPQDVDLGPGVKVLTPEQTPELNRGFPVIPYLKERISLDVGEIVEVRFRFKDGPQLWLQPESIKPNWVMSPLEHLGRYDFWIIVAWIIGSPVLAIIATLISVRQINRPLKRLQIAARHIGRGDHEAISNDPRDTEEVTAVNAAFNQMASSLQQATKDRALLLAGVSHDLRTPLTRMRLTAELLKTVDPELTEGIVGDIEDMDAILDQFISFIRDGSDEVAELGDINGLISEVVKQFEVNDCRIIATLHKLPEIYFKRLAFKRMLSNLINNGVKHGGGAIEVHTQVIEQEIIISVLDEGPGIDDAKISELFSPFARGDESRTTMGSGLGLAIVRRIVDMHHGRVELKNRPEGGLEAKVVLPMSGQLVAPESLPKGVR